MDATNQRKTSHVQIALRDAQIDRKKNYFDRIHLSHRALPEQRLEEVDTSIEFMGKRLSFPLIISSMTGGADEELARINQNLAAAAEAEGVALALGSQRVMLENHAAKESFSLRRFAPSTLLLANLGAVQLNAGVGLEACRSLVEGIGADGLCLHLNPLQEAIQPEGDTDFSGLAEKIGTIVRGLGRPVLVKEVGAGLSPEDVQRLLAVGVKYIDVAGSGGTSWSRIESCRSDEPEWGELFSDWGIPTPLALRMIRPWMDELEVVASGGIRNGIDLVKGIVLGASLGGMALPLLRPAQESVEAVRKEIRQIRRTFATAMFLLGARRVEDIKNNERLLLNESWD